MTHCANKGAFHSAPASWLCVRFSHLGDVTLTTGVLDWLGRTRGWTFDCLTGEGLADIFTGHPHVRRVVSLDTRQGAGSLTTAFMELARQYKGWGLLDLHGNLRSRLLASLWRGPVARYRKMGLARRLFLVGDGRWFGPSLRALSVPQRYALAVVPKAPPALELAPRIWLDKEEIAVAGKSLAGLFGAGVSPVALHPYATNPLKAWPEGHFLTLAQALDAKGVPWICLGRGQSLFPGRAEDFTNRTSLRETCALLAHCRALVTGDSGPMHLASAVQTPVVALFGPTTREWGFYPVGVQDVVLDRDIACRPCSLHGKSSCPRNRECLVKIAPEAVLSALERYAVQQEGIAGDD